MKIHDCKQGTPYWHTIRLHHVTGSMFSIVKGNGATRTKYMKELIDELRTGNPRESFVNSHMQHGTEMEPFARAAYEKETGVKVQEVGFVEYNENIGVSPDGMIEPGGRLEIKCPTLEVHNKTVKADKVPSSHKPQIQGTLWVTEGKWLDFVSYHPDAETPLFVKRVYPDEAYITELKIRIYMFIADMKAMMKETEDLRKDSEMQQTGTITSVMPRLESGIPVTFTTTNGTFYKFDMTINTQAGPITGEINSKSPQYPKNLGEQIVIEITSDPQYGNKFKAINPQYAGQQQAPQQPQTPPQTPLQGPTRQGFQQAPAQQSHTPPPQTPPRDVQDEIRFAQGLNRACEEYNHDRIAEPSIELRTLMYYEILKTRVFPAALSSTSNVFDTPVEQDDIPI